MCHIHTDGSSKKELSQKEMKLLRKRVFGQEEEAWSQTCKRTGGNLCRKRHTCLDPNGFCASHKINNPILACQRLTWRIMTEMGKVMAAVNIWRIEGRSWIYFSETHSHWRKLTNECPTTIIERFQFMTVVYCQRSFNIEHKIYWCHPSFMHCAGRCGFCNHCELQRKTIGKRLKA